MRVGDNQRAQDGVHDGVEGSSGEGSEGERNQADTDQSEINVSRGFSPRMPGVSEKSYIVWHCSAQMGAQTSQKTSGSCPRRGGLREWEQGRSLSG